MEARQETTMSAEYYAEAFSPLPGRCFRLVSRQDGQAGPTHCPEPSIWRGRFRAKNGRVYGVAACTGHADPLTDRRPLRS
jgi:hypothetical protein